MGLKLTFDLSDRDIRYFQDALRQSRNAVRDADEAEIIDAIRQVLDGIRANTPLPDFVEKRIPELEALIQMLVDDEWQLPAEDREQLLATFVYFGDPEDIIPDDIPVIGYLDDVIMLELAARAMVHIRQAYADFCEFRDDFDRDNRNIDAVVRRDRLDRRRQQLHQRMRRRSASDKKNRFW